MATLDIHTLVFLANLVSLAMAALFLLVAHGEQGRNRHIHLWTLSFLLKAAGLLLIFLRPAIPALVSYALGNTLLALSAQALLLGLRVLEGRSIRWAWNLGGGLATVGFLVSAYPWADYARFVSSVGLLILVFEGACLVTLSRMASTGSPKGHRLVAVVLAVDIALILFRLGWLNWNPSAALPAAPILFAIQIILGGLMLGASLLALVYRRALAEQETLIAQLEQTLGDVRTLEGLFPICSWCKRIRDEDGAWFSVEQYVSERTDANFSHGVCPDCRKGLA